MRSPFFSGDTALEDAYNPPVICVDEEPRDSL